MQRPLTGWHAMLPAITAAPPQLTAAAVAAVAAAVIVAETGAAGAGTPGTPQGSGDQSLLPAAAALLLVPAPPASSLHSHESPAAAARNTHHVPTSKAGRTTKIFTLPSWESQAMPKGVWYVCYGESSQHSKGGRQEARTPSGWDYLNQGTSPGPMPCSGVSERVLSLLPAAARHRG